jgi:hypothetical protein
MTTKAGIGFDYDAPSVPATAVADVAAEITSHGKLPPLSDEEREQRRIEIEAFREKQAWRAQERRIERERREAEAEAVARHEAAIERAEANRKARLERSAEISRQTRERELRDLHMKVAQQEWWQISVKSAARNTAAYQARQTLMNELEAMANPPPPPSEPEPQSVYVGEDEGSPHLGDPNFNPDLWKKI